MTDSTNPAPVEEPAAGTTPPETPATDTATDAQEAPTSDFMNDPAVIAHIDKMIAEGIQKGIQEALKGKPPKANTVNPTAQEKAEFEKMTYKERLQLLQNNPQAYQKLTKGSA